MDGWGEALIVALAAGGIVFLGWWLLIETEGVYLGRRVVIWLYDVFANRYDEIKGYRRELEHQYLSQPLMEMIAPETAPLVLDVATGTGRMPLALVEHKRFAGRIVATDLSVLMLRHATLKLRGDARVALLVSNAEELPFPDGSFDVVTCLEALEFMPHIDHVLYELVRVLRPNGLLLVTNRINTRWMPGKTMSHDELAWRLEQLGMEDVLVEYWQIDYDRVWGRKAGLERVHEEG